MSGLDKKQLLLGMIVDGTGNAPYYGAVGIDGGTITFVHALKDTQSAKEAFLDGEYAEDRLVFEMDKNWILPGFVDIHVHGGGGADVMDGELESIRTLCRHHLLHGTTSIAPTTMTASREAIEKSLETVMEFKQLDDLGGMVLGVHLEGPFISSRWPGAQNPEFISKARVDWLETWVHRFPGLICQLTLAPELQGAEETVKLAVRHGIMAACGHTNATYEQMTDAISWGVSHGVHCCNAMSPFHHRNPGVVGAVLLHDELTTEMIIDGHHLHPAAAKLICKNKQDTVCLVTDAMRASGMEDGVYHFSGLKVHVAQGAARIDNGSLAGSTLTMDLALRNVVQTLGIPLHQAVRHAAEIPARIIGATAKGTIAHGKDADLVIIGRDDWEVKNVMLGGRWNRGSKC